MKKKKEEKSLRSLKRELKEQKEYTKRLQDINSKKDSQVCDCRNKINSLTTQNDKLNIDLVGALENYNKFLKNMVLHLSSKSVKRVDGKGSIIECYVMAENNDCNILYPNNDRY